MVAGWAGWATWISDPTSITANKRGRAGRKVRPLLVSRALGSYGDASHIGYGVPLRGTLSFAYETRTEQIAPRTCVRKSNQELDAAPPAIKAGSLPSRRVAECAETGLASGDHVRRVDRQFSILSPGFGGCYRKITALLDASRSAQNCGGPETWRRIVLLSAPSLSVEICSNQRCKRGSLQSATRAAFTPCRCLAVALIAVEQREEFLA